MAKSRQARDLSPRRSGRIEDLHDIGEALADEFGDVDDEVDAAIGHLLTAAKIMESDE